MAREAIREENWTLLRELGKENRQELWGYLADKMENKKTYLPQDDCTQILNNREKANLGGWCSCSDREWLQFSSYLFADPEMKTYLEEKFINIYMQSSLDEFINRENFRNGLIWDTNIELSLAPRRTELFLLLPENKRLRSAIDRRIQRIKGE